MNGTINVSPEKLLSTSSEFSSSGSTINSLTSQMLNMVSSLTSVWEGEASTAFVSKFNKLNDDINTLNRMIQEHVTDLNQMAEIYKNAEQANTDDSASLATDVIS